MKLDTLLKSLLLWEVKCRELPGEREWFHYDFKGENTVAAVNEYFDRRELNEEFKKNFQQTDVTKIQPYTPIQAEIQAIHSIQRSYVARMKTRLDFYADDCKQKLVGNFDAINDNKNKLMTFKDRSKA